MDFFNLKNKRILVTGAGSGIGAAIAGLFAKQGAILGIHYRSNKEGAENCLKLVQKHSEGIMLQADLTRPEQVLAMSNRFLDAFEGIDILINNAGDLIQRENIENASIEYQDRVYETNVKSVVLVTQQFLPSLKISKGTIVNIGSVAGHNGGAEGSGLYAAAKAAVHTLTLAMAKEFAKYSIRVNSILPGFIETPFHNRYSTPERKQKVAESTPLGRNGTPADVANAILFLSSDASSFITGEYIAVNGGLYMRA